MTRLEQLRLDAHLTRADLAAATDVPERTIRALEALEVRKPRLATLQPLAKRLKVPVSELLADLTASYDERVAA